MADTFPVNRNVFKNKKKEIREVSEVDKESQRKQLNIMKKLFSLGQPGSENRGTDIGGFISMVESVKPRGKDTNKPDPTPSLAGNKVGKDISNTKTPSEQAAVDTLTGEQTAAVNKLKRAVADGNPAGIRSALQDGFNATQDEIKAGVQEAKSAAQDPVVKEQMRKFGMDESVFDQVAVAIDEAPQLVAGEDISSNIALDQKNLSLKQMSNLDNPFGSFKSKLNIEGFSIGDPVSPKGLDVKTALSKTGLNVNDLIERNPFGPKGVDKGNILGSAVSQINSVPTMKQVGLEVPSLPVGSPDFDEAPKIIDTQGFTDMFNIIKKGELMNSGPSVPIEKIGTTTGGDGAFNFLYTKVTGVDELELELRTIKRTITNVNVGWTGTAADQKYSSAKSYNDIVIGTKEIALGILGSGATLPLHEKSAWMHYFIHKDGTVERVQHLETFGNTKHMTPITSLVPDLASRLNLENIDTKLSEGISVMFDAGHNSSTSEKTEFTFSRKSISDEQWISFDKVSLALTSAFPYIDGFGHDQLLNDDKSFGPGFNVDEYLIKYTGFEEER